LIDSYLDAKSQGDYLEMRAVKLAVTMEFLKSVLIELPEYKEAVIDQYQALDLIELISADFIWVGKVNKCPEAEEKKIMTWPEFRAKAEAKLQELGKHPGIGYQIKSHLSKAR